MTTGFYNGLAYNIASVLPSTKNISSTTNASPIVVTTSTAHGLLTGDYVSIVGADDPNANGIFKAGTIAGLTFVLLNVDGTSTTGTLAGGANGTVQNINYGEEYAIPVDVTQKMTAASVNVALEALGDRTSWLLYAIRYANIYRPGGSSYMFDTHSIGGVWDFGGADVLGLAPRLVDIAPTLLTDADHTIGISGGRRYRLSATPAAVRTISIAKTGGDAPRAGETIDILVRAAMATGLQYNIKRSGSANNICTINGTTAGTAGAFVRVLYDVDNEWHLDINSAGEGILPGVDA